MRSLDSPLLFLLYFSESLIPSFLARIAGEELIIYSPLKNKPFFFLSQAKAPILSERIGYEIKLIVGNVFEIHL